MSHVLGLGALSFSDDKENGNFEIGVQVWILLFLPVRERARFSRVNRFSHKVAKGLQWPKTRRLLLKFDEKSISIAVDQFGIRFRFTGGYLERFESLMKYICQWCIPVPGSLKCLHIIYDPQCSSTSMENVLNLLAKNLLSSLEKISVNKFLLKKSSAETLPVDVKVLKLLNSLLEVIGENLQELDLPFSFEISKDDSEESRKFLKILSRMNRLEKFEAFNIFTGHPLGLAESLRGRNLSNLAIGPIYHHESLKNFLNTCCPKSSLKRISLCNPTLSVIEGKAIKKSLRNVISVGITLTKAESRFTHCPAEYQFVDTGLEKFLKMCPNLLSFNFYANRQVSHLLPKEYTSQNFFYISSFRPDWIVRNIRGIFDHLEKMSARRDPYADATFTFTIGPMFQHCFDGFLEKLAADGRCDFRIVAVSESEENGEPRRGVDMVRGEWHILMTFLLLDVGDCNSDGGIFVKTVTPVVTDEN